MRLIGPRNSVARLLRGETVGDEMLFDTSPWGAWSDDDPLEYRLAEWWIDNVHDHVYGGEDPR